jgi:aryl-alcohol dehydrogenase-like predicted oxidoreductase
MQLRQLGRSELRVSPLCLGGNVFGWTADERTSWALLDRLVGAGLNFIDTADVYSAWVSGNRGGESEEIIGVCCAGGASGTMSSSPQRSDSRWVRGGKASPKGTS